MGSHTYATNGKFDIVVDLSQAWSILELVLFLEPFAAIANANANPGLSITVTADPNQKGVGTESDKKLGFEFFNGLFFPFNATVSAATPTILDHTMITQDVVTITKITHKVNGKAQVAWGIEDKDHPGKIHEVKPAEGEALLDEWVDGSTEALVDKATPDIAGDGGQINGTPSMIQLRFGATDLQGSTFTWTDEPGLFGAPNDKVEVQQYRTFVITATNSQLSVRAVFTEQQIATAKNLLFWEQTPGVGNESTTDPTFPATWGPLS